MKEKPFGSQNGMGWFQNFDSQCAHGFIYTWRPQCFHTSLCPRLTLECYCNKQNVNNQSVTYFCAFIMLQASVKFVLWVIDEYSSNVLFKRPIKSQIEGFSTTTTWEYYLGSFHPKFAQIRVLNVCLCSSTDSILCKNMFANLWKFECLTG